MLFDFDKAQLLNISKTELNKLSRYLKTNPSLTIEIYGHTDAVGLDSRNQELSEQRAQAVANYLITQGISTTRIKWFGFGSSQPISTNTTEQGRQQNRRVAFKFIKT